MRLRRRVSPNVSMTEVERDGGCTHPREVGRALSREPGLPPTVALLSRLCVCVCAHARMCVSRVLTSRVASIHTTSCLEPVEVRLYWQPVVEQADTTWLLDEATTLQKPRSNLPERWEEPCSASCVKQGFPGQLLQLQTSHPNRRKEGHCQVLQGAGTVI